MTHQSQSLERLLEQTIDTLRAAEQRQRHHTDPYHEDFALWAQALTAIPKLLGQAGDTLIDQLDAYERDQASRPELLRSAGERLGALTATLKAASYDARDYHHTITRVHARQ